MIEKGEIIEIPVENPTYFTKAKQQETRNKGLLFLVLLL